MCQNDISKSKEHYKYHSMFSSISFVVCYKCAIREYYGTKTKAGNKWKREQKAGKLFGR